jgi:hypothetical protein
MCESEDLDRFSISARCHAFLHPIALARRLLQLLRGSSSWRASLSLYYCDPGALSGVVIGPSLASTMKTASKLAGSLSLAFSLIL